jgi:hypothetical protein
MKILAFMQNPWFPPSTRREYVDRYRTDQEFHKYLLARTMSGQRLLQAFGPEMFDSIHWDNVAPEAAEEASGKTDIDHEHVERVILHVMPDLIISFGKLAEEALDGSIYAIKIPYMCCHHPNARGYTMADLAQFAVDVQQKIEEMKLQ